MRGLTLPWVGETIPDSSELNAVRAQAGCPHYGNASGTSGLWHTTHHCRHLQAEPDAGVGAGCPPPCLVTPIHGTGLAVPSLRLVAERHQLSDGRVHPGQGQQILWFLPAGTCHWQLRTPHFTPRGVPTRYRVVPTAHLLLHCELAASR